MHIPDGFLSNPVNAATALASVGVAAVAIRSAGRTLGERQIPLLGVTGAFIFAAQMLNFPIGAGTSGHLMGSTLATYLLGPLNAFLVMAIVLVIQCLLFADGGITALGSNIFLMGIAGVAVSYAVLKGVGSVAGHSAKGETIAVAAASWATIVVASAVCAGMLSFSGTAALGVVLPSMVGVHAVIGIGEALITCAVVTTIRAVRADLLPTPSPSTR